MRLPIINEPLKQQNFWAKPKRFDSTSQAHQISARKWGMNASEIYRMALSTWAGTAGPMFPRLCSKIRTTLADRNVTEADYAELIGEVNRSGGPIIGIPADDLPAAITTTARKEFKKEELPAEFRNGEKPDGQPMIQPFVQERFGLTTSNLTRDFKKRITGTVKVGRNLCWRYKDILAISEWRNSIED